jgi:hypothetical protein
VPVTDGKSLYVSSDFDRRLSVWRNLPDESGAKPDWVYELPFAPWDNGLHGGRLVVAGKDTVAIWNQPPLEGELPDLLLRGRIGGIELREVRGVDLDQRYFYLTDFLAGRLYVWEGVPSPGSEPAFTFEIRQPARVASDGEMVVVTSTETHTLYLFRVDEIDVGYQPRVVGGPGTFNLPQAAVVAAGTLFVADTTGNRVMIWNNLDAAVARQRPDVVLGEETDRRPGIADRSLFWPATPAFDGSHLWIGEFKFSGRLLRYTIEP